MQLQQQQVARPGSTSFDPTVRNLQLATGKVDGYRHAVKVRALAVPPSTCLAAQQQCRAHTACLPPGCFLILSHQHPHHVSPLAPLPACLPHRHMTWQTCPRSCQRSRAEDYRRKLWGSQFILPAGKGTACMHAYACLWDPSLLLTAPCLLPLRAAPGADPNADVSPQLIRMRGWLLRIVRAMEL